MTKNDLKLEIESLEQKEARLLAELAHVEGDLEDLRNTYDNMQDYQIAL